MDKNTYRGSYTKKFLPYLVFALVFLFVLHFVLTGLREASSSSAMEGMRIAEESIRRAVINCYASEGMYPPSIDYLREHYGIAIDERRYVIHYQIYGSNLMPDIAVFKVEGGL